MSGFLLFLMYTTGCICEYEQQKFVEQEKLLENVKFVQWSHCSSSHHLHYFVQFVQQCWKEAELSFLMKDEETLPDSAGLQGCRHGQSSVHTCCEDCWHQAILGAVCSLNGLLLARKTEDTLNWTKDLIGQRSQAHVQRSESRFNIHTDHVESL